MNGFTNDQVLQMLLDGQRGVQAQLALLIEKVDTVRHDGCAHRTDDLRRIQELEGWRTKGIIGTIGLFIMAVAALIRKL